MDHNDDYVAMKGAHFGQTAHDAAAEAVGHHPSAIDMGNFSIGAIDVIFTATFGIIYRTLSPEQAREWANFVMQKISEDVTKYTGVEMTIQIVTKDAPSSSSPPKRP